MGPGRSLSDHVEQKNCFLSKPSRSISKGEKPGGGAYKGRFSINKSLIKTFVNEKHFDPEKIPLG